MPDEIYDKFILHYNLKQWGVHPRELKASLCSRFDVRSGDERRFKPDVPHQGIPTKGYAEWTRRMFEGIPVILNYDFLKRRGEIEARRRLIFTGPIDEFFGFSLGKLKYRGQKRETTYHRSLFAMPEGRWLGAGEHGQVNNPTVEGGPHIRTLNWKNMMPRAFADQIQGHVQTRETPFTPTDPNEYEYPFPDDEFDNLSARYKEMAKADNRLLVCGRLGEGKYYDMDQAIARGMVLAQRLLEEVT
jgi:UDP-galactopyranose mutase